MLKQTETAVGTQEMNELQIMAEAVARIDRGVAKLLEAQEAAVAEWLSVAQAAQVTGLSDTTIRRAIGGRDLAASNVGSEQRPVWRIARRDLTAWMEKQKGGTEAVPPRGELGQLVDRYFGPPAD